MKLTDSYKQKLNILIPYYRNQNLKETGEGIWQQSAFYTNSDTKLPVCSSKLYCGLEKQRMLVRDVIYEFAAEKLNKRVMEDDEWNQIIDKTAHQVCKLMDFRKEKESINVLEKACRRLEICRGVLYYEEILWLFEILKAYFSAMDQVITESEFYHLDAITTVFHNDLKQLAMYYLYVYANHNEDEKIGYVLNKYEYHASQLLSNQLFAMNADLRKGKILNFLDTGKELEKLFQETNNKIQLYYLYMKLIAAYIDIDISMACKYIEKIKNFLLTNDELSLRQKSTGYMNMGTLLLYAGRYEDSIEYLEEAIKLSDRKLVRCEICISHAYRMLRLPIPHQYLITDDVAKGDMVDWLLYVFFYNLETVNNEEQKKYLIKKVLPFLEINDKLYLKILEEELELLCDNEKGYKAIYDYHVYVRKKSMRIMNKRGK